MVSQFAFGKSLDALADPEFKSLPVRVFQQYLPSLHVIKAFPFVRMLNSLPLWIAKRISHTVEMGHELEQVNKPAFPPFLLLLLMSFSLHRAELINTLMNQLKAKNLHSLPSWNVF